jgi:hypothetical protein
MNLDIFFLGIIDNIHDFFNHNKNKEQLELMINFLKKIYDIEDLDVSKLDNSTSYLKSLIDEIKNVDIPTVKNNIKKYFLKDGISIKEINSNIIKNFDIVFFYKINDKNIKDLLSDLTKIKLRNQLYYLIELYRNNIENKYDKEINELIMFFLNYLNLLFLSDLEITNILKIIKTNIKKFINSKIKNYTYPITFFDDMTSGIDNFIYFNNQIINLDKTRIDGARTKNIDSYLTKKLDTNIYIKSDKEQGEESIGFKITSDLKVKYMNFNYYLEDLSNNYNIVCKFKNIKFYDKTLKFEFKNNDIPNILYVVNDISNFIKYVKDNKDKKTLPVYEIDQLLSKSGYNKLFDRENLLLYLKNILKLVKKSIDDEIIKGFIITILFGLKRFGDWIQFQASKKYYFLVQTKDFYSQIYGFLIKAPVIIEDIIYNYNPPDSFLLNLSFNENELKIFGSKTIKDLTDEKIIIRSLKDIEVEPNRLYLDKYLKYKKKYLDLKALIEQTAGYNIGDFDNKIPPQVIEELKQKIDTLSYEVCGHFEKIDNLLYPVYSTQERITSGRKACNYDEGQKDKPFIFHTHIKASKYYPSIEDIESSYVKRNNIHFIFTIYGYWIYKTYKPLIRQFFGHDRKRAHEIYNEEIEKLLTNFYRATGRGKIFNQTAIDTLITDLFNKLKLFDFEITFIKYV